MKKESPEITAELETKVKRLAEKINNGRALQHLKGNPGWEALKALCRKHLAPSENVLENHLKYDLRAIEVALAQKNSLTFIMEIIEQFETNEGALTLELQNLQNEINERRVRENKQSHQA